MAESNVVYQAKLHWILFIGPVILACFAMFIGIEIHQLKEVALLFVVFSLAWIFMTWVNYHFSSLTIKKKQVILRTGMMVRKTIDIPLAKIESIDIRQSIVGSIFHYGTLIITGTGGTRHMIGFLDKPLTCRRYIEQLMHE
ncbi:Bacterial membrane flanked domain protein [Legionella massiliensis]|uniref:Bacterial membrane flanked domain protein n=1 Tax=Legionella massiliensis TaxID=1034943 RepID=A0A078KNA4_9GAMM|nr:PH domain-containing protein [Legionella massiliensis]CDZ75840.1 Bacterial membrane flanked domain protein [Legionella massiliensis]CEE11578.1 Bacterial membrane flanked domain protein [Legionella massiliensis]